MWFIRCFRRLFLNGASSSSENYLDKEFTDLIKSVSPENKN